MKILYKNTSNPLWAYLLGHGLVTLVTSLGFLSSPAYGIGFVVGGNLLMFFIITGMGNEKWKKASLENDPFFKDKGYTLAAPGLNSIIALSTTKLTVVNIKPEIADHKQNALKIKDVYVNYPPHDQPLELNGFTVSYSEISLSEVKNAQAVTQGEAGWKGSLKDRNFGIRITMKDDTIYDVDTEWIDEFCTEIKANISI
jgi:hypothetical protein